jgi:hypothetical protein
MPGAVAQFAGLMRTGSHDKIAFTDKNVKENYLCHWGRDGLTGLNHWLKFVRNQQMKKLLLWIIKKLLVQQQFFGRYMMLGCQKNLEKD